MLKEYNLDDNGLPEILVMLTSYFQARPDKLGTKGLFRVSGSQTEE